MTTTAATTTNATTTKARPRRHERFSTLSATHTQPGVGDAGLSAVAAWGSNRYFSL